MQVSPVQPKPSLGAPLKVFLGVFLLGPMYVMTTLTLLVMIAFFMIIVPKIVEINKEFGVQLSSLQRLLISTSDVLHGTFVVPIWIWAALAVMAIMTMVAVLFFRPRTKSLASVLIFVIFLLSALVATCTIFSCADAMGKLIEQLSEKGV